MRKLIKTITTTAVILCAVTTVNAGQIQPITGILQTAGMTTVHTGDSVVISQSLPTSGIADYDVINTISLNFDNTSTHYFTSRDSVTVNVSIYRWNSSGAAMGTVTTDLKVSTDPRYNRQSADKAIYKLLSGYRIRTVINSISENGSTITALPAYVYIEEEIDMRRYYQYTGTAPTISCRDTLDTDCDADEIIDELKINWSTVTGAEEYQLEWTFVNNYGYTDSTSSLPQTALYADFKNNSTRITTAFNTYRITNAFERGYIAFRVRAVGRDYLHPDKYVYGDWTSGDHVTVNSIGSSAKYYNWREHERSKNWQYSATFAEEGKKKEVISYFDGSLHNRQSVTKVNSDKNAIVGETIYDYQGRPAINVLPTPVDFSSCGDPFTSEPALKYYKEYNTNTLGHAYSKTDFDKDTLGSCSTLTAPMDTLTGSSLYYSPNNPNKDGAQAFVPDAQRYPYSQVEYTPDNTGRIRAQSGVGPRFQLGSTHETKYFYSSPNQVQLDRLFGSEAGDAHHYKKNMVVDANGQVSISYLNQEGKTIATSLAGNAPTDSSHVIFMDSVASAVGAAVPFTIDAFEKDATGVSSSNTITPMEDGIEFSTQLSVSYNSTYTFNYDLDIDTLADPCLRETFCMSCIYDLDLRVTDECGAAVTPGGMGESNAVMKRLGHLDEDGHFTMACGSPAGTTDDETITVNLTPGVYTVSKILSINKDARDFYAAAYLDSTYNSCIKTPHRFIADALAAIDTTACYTSCAECAAALGTKDDFVAAGRGTEVQYDFLLEQCMEPCRDRTLCENTYEMMLEDMTPGGQYAKFNAATGSAAGIDVSILNTSNNLPARSATGGTAGNWHHPMLILGGHTYAQYLDDNGERAKIMVSRAATGSGWSPEVLDTTLIATDAAGDRYIYPENLLYENDFIANWNEYFAHSLVIYHPEFAYYIACKDQSRIMSGDSISTETFDSVLIATTTFADAVTKGFIKSNYASVVDHNDRVTDWFTHSGTHAYDPFFSNPSAFNDFYGPFASTYTTSVHYHPYLQSASVSEMSSRITNYLPAGASTYTMYEAAAMAAVCGQTYTGAGITSPPCMNFGDTVYTSVTLNYAHLNDSILNLEWQNLKNYYIAEKRMLEYNRMNYFALHLADSPDPSMPSPLILGGCNACIGNSSFNPYVSGFLPYYPMPTFFAPAYHPWQPCSFTNFSRFTNNSKRFINPANTGLNLSDVPYQVYQQTGQCPMTFELGNFLNAMTLTGNLHASTSRFMSTVPSFGPDLYNAITASGSSYVDYKWHDTIIGSVLSARMLNGASNACTIQLNITGTSISSFNDIVGLQNLTYDNTVSGTDHFKVWATYLVGGGPSINNVQITGSSCFKLHGCEFEPTCHPNQLATDFMNLHNVMRANGHEVSTAYSMSWDTLISPALTPTIKTTLGTPNSKLIWKYVAPDHVQIYDSTNTSTKLVFTFLSFSPSSAMSSTAAFANIRSNYNNLFKMDALDTLGNVIALVEGKAEKLIGADTVELSMGECGLPPNAECSSTEHMVRKDLELLLGEVLTVKPFNGNVNLFAFPGFTSLLKTYFNDTLTMTTGTYVKDTATLTSYDTLTINTHNSCNFELYRNIHDSAAHAINFGNLVSVSNLTGIAPMDETGAFHDFYFLGTFVKGDSTYTDTVRGTSCLPLRNCGLCSPSVSIESADAQVCTKYLLSSFYAGYTKVVDSISYFNSSYYAGTKGVTVAIPSIGSYMHQNFLSATCYDYYIDSLMIRAHATDTLRSFPGNPCVPSIAAECDSLYEEYVNTVYDYNTYAGGAGYPDVPRIYAPQCFNKYFCTCAGAFIGGLRSIINGYPLTSANTDLLDISKSCAPTSVACSQPDTTLFEFPPVPYSPNLCVLQMIAAATQNALNEYNIYADSVTTDFISRYNQHCLHPLENLYYNYTDKEYHFTLYYYDQAGNLVKTVPPEGVDFLNINSDTSRLEIQVKQDRLNNTHTVFTSHRMATTYEYNSLNQLVRQDMPDHEKMDICESTAPNGLDNDLQITSVQFVTSNKGYLTGFVHRVIGGTTLQRGYVYTTNDAGQNWTRVKGVAAGDLQKVRMVSSSVGYAASDYGMIFKTLDNGFSWDAITTLYNASPQYFGTINDLAFASATTGWIGGTGVAYKTTDGGLTYSASTDFTSNDTITGITYDGTNYYASVRNGSGKTYYNSSGTTWTQLTNYAANDLKKIQYTGNDTAYAVGYDGTLLRSNSANSVWTLVATGSPYKFSDVFFKNGSMGVALVDSIAGVGKIYKTLDGGASWEQLSDPGKYYVSLQAYDPANGKVIAAGSRGLVSKVLMSTAPFGMSDVTRNMAGITDTMRYAQAISVSGKLPSLLVGKPSTVYYTNDAQGEDWTALTTTVTGGFKKALISVGMGASPVTKGIMLGNDGVLYKFYRVYNSTPSIASISASGSPYFTDITSSNTTNAALFYAYDTVNKELYSISYSGSTPSATLITGAVTQHINSISLSNSTSEMLMAGKDGAISYTNISGSVTWNTYTNAVVPLPLNDIEENASGIVTAVGDDGTEWYSANSGANWSLAVNNTSTNIHAIKLDSSDKGLIAGSSGNLFRVSSAMSVAPALTAISSGLTDDFYDVGLQNSGTKSFAVSSSGKCVYMSNYTTATSGTVHIAVNPNGALRGLAFQSTGGVAVAVGDKADVMLFSGGSGITINEVYTRALRNASFADNNNGYAADSGYVIRHTANGGNTWEVVLPDNTLPVTAKIYAAAVNRAILIGDNEYAAPVTNESVGSAVSVSGGVSSDFRDIAFNANGYGVIVGTNGWAARVTAACDTVVGISQASSVDFNAVHVFANMNNVSGTKHFIAAGTGGKIYYYKAGVGFTSQHGYSGYAGTEVFRDIYFHDDRTGYVAGDAGKAYKCSLVTNAGEAGSELLSANAAIWSDLCPLAIYQGRTSADVDFKTLAFSTRDNGVLAGSYASAGNHRHIVVLNDESGLYSTRFWYDKLGRMVVSQNTKQFNRSPKSFSYTLYDALGRIKEVGEKYENTTVTKQPSIFGTTINGFLNLKAIDDTKLLSWVNDTTGKRKEVTSTYYDEQLILPTSYANQSNLRKRVATVTYEDKFDDDSLTYQHATHYTYDIHGNVSTLWQENKKLYDTAQALSSVLTRQRYKRINYDYDLISGKVNKVTYQPDSVDQFIHRYTYDADNRITMAETSADDIVYDLDAKYFYYAHGPLARVEYGTNTVQGIDYAYTLQGWIKGVNSNSLDSTRDMGNDNYVSLGGNPNANFANDACGYTLNYYSGDYKAIDRSKWTAVANRFESSTASSEMMTHTHDLFNGNIKAMATSIVAIDTTAGGLANDQDVYPLSNAYHYDQLNRLTRSLAFDKINLATNVWNSSGSTANMYRNVFAYDANGNILQQVRYDDAGAVFDSLNYNYKRNLTTGKLMQNRLYHVNDPVSSGTKSDDIDDQGTFNANLNNININNNYNYDEIGNMAKDSTEEIDSIGWTVYGKIRDIIRKGGSSKDNLHFDYDASGNRISKRVMNASNVWKYTTYYVRDAQGNVMSTYDQRVVSMAMSFKLKEQDIFGSSRIGLNLPEKEIIGAVVSSTTFFHTLGKRQYELGNHLGNVLTTISDRKVAVDANTDGTTDYYLADIANNTDYYPFGAEMKSRQYVKFSNYRYGFNGQEKDFEIKGDGNSLDYGERIYDPRLAKFLSIDPLSKDYPFLTPYQFASNSPIAGIDIDGLEFYYAANGSLIGQIGDNTQVRVVDQNDVKAVKGWIIWANRTDNADYKAKAENQANQFSTALGVTQEQLIAFASVVDNESGGSKEESYAIANVTMNFLDEGGSSQLQTLEDVTMYDNTFAQGADKDYYAKFKEKKWWDQNKKYGVGAAINAIGFSKGLKTFSDYSNGADSWDGKDLVSTKFNNAHRGYKWSLESKTITEQYRKENNGGVKTSLWTYKKTGYQIEATKIIGKTLFTNLQGGRGEKKQSTVKFK
ncbi:MAG: RHS repeat-associated core domain-containing protein [Bacteroidia bacterium]